MVGWVRERPLKHNGSGVASDHVDPMQIVGLGLCPRGVCQTLANPSLYHNSRRWYHMHSRRGMLCGIISAGSRWVVHSADTLRRRAAGVSSRKALLLHRFRRHCWPPVHGVNCPRLSPATEMIPALPTFPRLGWHSLAMPTITGRTHPTWRRRLTFSFIPILLANPAGQPRL
jgi:hypothetical protein